MEREQNMEKRIILSPADIDRLFPSIPGDVTRNLAAEFVYNSVHISSGHDAFIRTQMEYEGRYGDISHEDM